MASVAFLPAMAIAAEALPAPADLHKMYDDQQYKPLLAQLAKIMPMTGPAAKQYDKIDLAVLKTNTLIMLKQPQPAVSAAGEAVKNLGATPDPAVAAQVHTLQILVTSSPKLVYTPKAAGTKPMPLDTSARDEVLKALLTDRQADDAAKAKAAKTDQSINDVVEVINHVNQTRWVELAVTQSDTGSTAAVDELVTTAQSLMSDAIPPMANRVKAIGESINGFNVSQRDPAHHVVWGSPTTKGLSPADIRELKTDVATCNKISATCDDFSALAKDHADEFKKISKSAQQTSKDASELLQQFRIQ